LAIKTFETESREIVQLLAQVIACSKRSGVQPPPDLVAAAERGDLGPRHAAPLLALSFEDALSVSELAERLGLSLPATSQLVGELSRAALLERSEDPRDRRVTLVRLPEEHREAVQLLVDRQAEPVRRTLERLAPRARADFLEAMRILAEESARAAEHH
jgi:DNA-binding MarR family transcriptional regulator